MLQEFRVGIPAGGMIDQGAQSSATIEFHQGQTRRKLTVGLPEITAGEHGDTGFFQNLITQLTARGGQRS